MKRLALLWLLCFSSYGVIFALDHEAWLTLARDAVSQSSTFEVGESPEDGLYCMAIEEICITESKSQEACISEAMLMAKRKLVAYVHGEKTTASREARTHSITVTEGDEEKHTSTETFDQRISTKVDALMRGIKPLGQISVDERIYVVCLTTENQADESAILIAAQEQYGEEGVVVSTGEATERDLALQKALRGAVEQVLGTLVVGCDKMSSSSDFQRKIFSGTDGVVDTYRILSEGDCALGTRIQVVAKVSKDKLLDNYSNYMKFIGDPAFYIDSSSPDLTSHFTNFFSEMGIRITKDPQQAAYIIHCTGNFREVKHPTNGRTGTQLSVRFRIQASQQSEVLLEMTNNPRKSASFLNNPERRIEVCAEKAFAQMRKPLHEKIHAMIGTLVSREMEALEAED